MFVLSSDITIGDLRFEGVHSITIKRSVHSLIETAVIEVPAVAYLQEKGKTSPKRTVTTTQIKSGSEVHILLGYNGEMKTEFEGYVVSCKPGTPVQIVCEGASYLLRQNTCNATQGKTTVKAILQEAVANLKSEKTITVTCTVEMDVINTCSATASGLEVISKLMQATSDNLCCFFIRPFELWCGLLYSRYTAGIRIDNGDIVSYKIGYNTLKQNTLDEHAQNVKPAIVEYKRKNDKGEILSGISENEKGAKTKETTMLNQILHEKSLASLADEKATKNNYKGYEGSITAFLQPYAAPGSSAKVVNSNMPEMDDTYLIESTEVTYGVNGARRKIELGPRLGTDRK